MKKIKGWKHEKEFDTRTLILLSPDTEDAAENSSIPDDDSGDPQKDSDIASKETRKAVDLKDIADAQNKASDEKVTQVYEPRPLTPDDDIYEDIIEQFASAPTKPKYWFEEFGDYWSCSCGHINKGDRCKSCGLERELLRSLFILHKPAGAPGKLNKKLSKATKEKIDQEERQQADKENRRRQREAAGDDGLTVVPIETDGSAAEEHDLPEEQNEVEVKVYDPSEEAAENEDTAESTDTDTIDTPDNGENDNISDNDTDSEIPETDETASSPVRATSGDTNKKTEAAAVNTQKKEPNKSESNAIVPVPAQKKKAPAKPDDKKRLSFRVKIIIAIVACMILIGGCGTAIYYYMAAPAMQYQDAQQLQAKGKYEKAIEKYKALGDYKNCKELIWECYCSMADRYFKEGEYNKAIDTYNIAIDLKDDQSLHDKIWNCYIAIGDQHLNNGEYEKALSTYYVAADLKDNEDIQAKINLTKFTYVKAYKDDRTAKVEEYMSDLMAVKYSGIQEIYDEYYAWHVSIVANTSEDDNSSDVSTVSRKDTVYFHATLSGGEPSEQIMLYYEVTWPGGQSQIFDLDSTWKSGSVITARFQYPMPIFGKEGKLTFKLYDRSTNELLGSDTVTFEH